MPMLVTMLPIASQVSMLRFTLLMPPSPASWMPLWLASFQMKSPMVTSAHGAHSVLHVHAGSAGKVFGSQFWPSLSQLSVRTVHTPADVVHTPSGGEACWQVPSHTPSPAPSDVSQSTFTMHTLPTFPPVQNLQSASPLFTLQLLVSSNPPEHAPVSQLPLTWHTVPTSSCAPAEQNLSLQSVFCVQVLPWPGDETITEFLVFNVVHTPPFCTVPSPQDEQSARQPLTP